MNPVRLGTKFKDASTTDYSCDSSYNITFTLKGV